MSKDGSVLNIDQEGRIRRSESIMNESIRAPPIGPALCTVDDMIELTVCVIHPQSMPSIGRPRCFASRPEPEILGVRRGHSFDTWSELIPRRSPDDQLQIIRT